MSHTQTSFPLLPVGVVAERSGVSVSALYFYEAHAGVAALVSLCAGTGDEPNFNDHMAEEGPGARRMVPGSPRAARTPRNPS